MTEALMVFGSIVLGAAAIIAVVVWLNRLSACDPYDPTEQCG